MHIEAMDFCWRAHKIVGPVSSVVEFGGRNVNGSARDIWPDARWTSLDLEAGPGVDIVGDATAVPPVVRHKYAMAISTEMLEHCTHPRLAVAHMVEAATDWVLVTCATDPRAAHSAGDGGPLKGGEHYRNVEPSELEHPFLEPVLREIHDRGDLYQLARVIRPKGA